jgi:chorismate dehydratase
MIMLKIGRFFYSNLFPIYYMLDKEADCSFYEFVEGVPSFLNREIREGRIDVSPSSSIEYLRNHDRYDLIEGHSISSRGPVGSVFLFSRRPLEQLGGSVVLTSSQSETSVALLRIILEKFLGIKCEFRSTPDHLEKVMQSSDACLVIGDDALKESLRWPSLHIYDIGDLWYRHTGLPAVFALWIVRKESSSGKKDLVRRFTQDLDKAKASALKNLDEVAAASPPGSYLSREELVSYWRGISYDFGEDHKRGLELFRQSASELDLL